MRMPMIFKTVKNCRKCQQEFETRSNAQKYCEQCRRARHAAMASKRCPTCEKDFETRRSGQKYCSAACRPTGYTRLAEKLPTATTGAISELKVAADLLGRGYEVFRALSASCSCDLAILGDGKLVRVEVRTGYKLKNGKIQCSLTPHDQGRHDILAICLSDQIVYNPPM